MSIHEPDMELRLPGLATREGRLLVVPTPTFGRLAPQFPVCISPNRSQLLPLKRMNCIWSTGT